jgi:L-aspartate oxidase
LVLGERTGERAAESSRDVAPIPFDRRARGERPNGSNDVRLSIQDMTYSLKSLMWRQLGIVRSGAAIADAIKRVEFWSRAVHKLATPDPRSWELSNMLTIARLLAHAAFTREESRGAHFREDFTPSREAWRAHTLLTPAVEGERVRCVQLGRELARESVAVR